jgi:hypothetical protein
MALKQVFFSRCPANVKNNRIAGLQLFYVFAVFWIRDGCSHILRIWQYPQMTLKLGGYIFQSLLQHLLVVCNCCFWTWTGCPHNMRTAYWLVLYGESGCSGHLSLPMMGFLVVVASSTMCDKVVTMLKSYTMCVETSSYTLCAHAPEHR